jgi:hypothetical protein
VDETSKLDPADTSPELWKDLSDEALRPDMQTLQTERLRVLEHREEGTP